MLKAISCRCLLTYSFAYLPIQILYQDCYAKTTCFIQDYKFEMIPIIIGALGYVPNELKTNLEKLNFNEKEVKSTTRKLQTISASGTVTVMKTFIGFKM